MKVTIMKRNVCEMKESDVFVLVEASKLSLADDFMQYEPHTERERMLKDSLKTVIENGIHDFWCPRLAPSFDKKGNICFKAGLKPAIGKPCSWWDENAKKFLPKRNSRLGTKSQYVAFLGVLIKALVAEKWTVEDAWNAVCFHSEKLGHYRNSKDPKFAYEPTGSRAVAVFYDLANVYKILADDEVNGWYCMASGCYDDYSYGAPLFSFHCNFYNYGVGWIVFE